MCQLLISLSMTIKARTYHAVKQGMLCHCQAAFRIVH